MMTCFNYDIFKIDINKKRHSELKTIKQICSEIQITKSTYSQIKNKKPITLYSFTKIIKWLKTDVNRYFL
jgi:hypothetical protein